MTLPIQDEPDFVLAEWQKKVIQNDILLEVFDEDMERRKKLSLLKDKYIQCMRRLRNEWEPKLVEAGYILIPSEDDLFAELVFSHPEYKNRSQRDAQSINSHLPS
jgi:hypothetical protein